MIFGGQFRGRFSRLPMNEFLRRQSIAVGKLGEYPCRGRTTTARRLDVEGAFGFRTNESGLLQLIEQEASFVLSDIETLASLTGGQEQFAIVVPGVEHLQLEQQSPCADRQGTEGGRCDFPAVEAGMMPAPDAAAGRVNAPARFPL